MRIGLLCLLIALISLPLTACVLPTEPDTKIVINEDGENLFTLMPDSTQVDFPSGDGWGGSGRNTEQSWSPDGMELVYVHSSDIWNEDQKLVSVDQDGFHRTVLDQSWRIAVPQWSPSGNRVLYLRKLPPTVGSTMGSWHLAAVSKEPDGSWSESRVICHDYYAGWGLRNPEPFIFYDDRHIVRLDYDASSERSIARTFLDDCHTDFFRPSNITISWWGFDVSRDGKIAFIGIPADGPSSQSLFVADSFRPNSARVIEDSSGGKFPVWSNNGRKLAFLQFPDEWNPTVCSYRKPVIKIFDLTTGELLEMTSTIAVSSSDTLSGPGLGSPPELQIWSPHDRRLVFIGSSEPCPYIHAPQIFVLDVVNDSVTPLTRPRRDTWYPYTTWQPETPDIADLAIEEANVRTNTQSHNVEISFRILNIGTRLSEETSVYVNAIDSNASMGQIRQQDILTVDTLYSGQETTDMLSILPLSDLGPMGIDTFEIIVDPKNLVLEYSEANNKMTLSTPREE